MMPRKGDRYVVTTDFTTIMLIQFLAPFTGGEDRTLPRGMRFVVLNDPPSHATAVAARPEPYEEWEAKLVPEKDLTSATYGGYHLVIKFDQLTKCCERLRGSDVPI